MSLVKMRANEEFAKMEDVKKRELEVYRNLGLKEKINHALSDLILINELRSKVIFAISVAEAQMDDIPDFVTGRPFIDTIEVEDIDG